MGEGEEGIDMKLRSRGTETRYDADGCGNHLDRIRASFSGPRELVGPRVGKLFCETCQKFKPKNKTPAHKGWKCTECKKSIDTSQNKVI